MKLFKVYNRFDIALSRAEGVYVYDEKDNKYLDLYGGHGVISIGHSHPTYIKYIQDQLSKIGFYSNSVQMPIQIKLAKKLCISSGYTAHQLFLCNSGAEANENALKLASFHTGRKKVLAFKGSFHGRTAAALNVTENSKLSAPLNLNNFEVEFIDLNDEDALTNHLQTQTFAAVIIEGIQGVGGLDTATADYFKLIEASCKANGTLLIIDEIQSGFGRSGKFFAHQHAGISADLITMAKGMGNGFPIGGVLIDPKIEAKMGMLGTTFGGNQLACAASLAVLDTIKAENLIPHAETIGAYLAHELKAIPKVKQVKGTGLMIGLEFDFPIKDLRIELIEKYKIFTGASANQNLLRILPPLCIQKEELTPFIEALKTILK